MLQKEGILVGEITSDGIFCQFLTSNEANFRGNWTSSCLFFQVCANKDAENAQD